MNPTSHHRDLRTWALAWLAIIPLLASCAGPVEARHDPGGRVILYAGSAAYANRTATLQVKPSQASSFLLERLRRDNNASDSPAVLAGFKHAMLVDDCYHFHPKQKHGDIPLSGYYVNGHSGAVDYRVVEGSIPYPRGAGR